MSNDNFNPNEQIITQALENFKKPHEFGKTMIESLKESHSLRNEISNIVINIISKDEACRSTIYKLVDTHNDDAWKKIRNKAFIWFGIGIWTLLVIIITAFVNSKF